MKRPKVHGTERWFASQLLGADVTCPKALEALVVAGFVCGLSTRDVEATWPRHWRHGRRCRAR